jgi:hypothetical protein
MMPLYESSDHITSIRPPNMWQHLLHSKALPALSTSSSTTIEGRKQEHPLHGKIKLHKIGETNAQSYWIMRRNVIGDVQLWRLLVFDGMLDNRCSNGMEGLQLNPWPILVLSYMIARGSFPFTGFLGWYRGHWRHTACNIQLSRTTSHSARCWY